MEAVHAAAPTTVATLDSSDARALVHDAAGVESVAELLLPWTSSIRNVGVTTSQLGRKTCSVFPLRLTSLPLPDRGEPALAKGDLEGVEAALSPALAGEEIPPLDIRGDAPDPHTAAPWHQAFRQTLLDPMADNLPYDPLTHPVAILCAVSSRNPDPLAAMAKLHTASMAADVLPSYMSTQIMRFYLLLHDSAHTVPLSTSEEHLEQLKTTYGLNASLVPLNSRPPPGPTVEVQSAVVETTSHPAEEEDVHIAWGERYCQALRSPLPANTFARGLSLGDTDALQAFLRTFVAQSLVPWMERSVQQWQLTLFDSKRGLTSRLWGGLNSSNSRRLWGVSRATSLSLSSAKSIGTAVSRTSSVREKHSEKAEDGSLTLNPTTGGVMMRRLGDFAWTLHDYGFAMTCYEHAHRDLLLPELGRSGAIYAASAISQWGLARLLNELERRENSPSARMTSPVTEEEASQSLVLAMDNPPSGPVWSSTALLLLLRATEKQYHLLKQLGFVRAAASRLESMAALAPRLGGGGNIPGVLYEQAALMRLLASVPEGKRPSRRKAALDLVLAAEGYGDKPVAERALKAAYALDSFSRWPNARAHIASRLVGKGDATTSIIALLSAPGITEQEVEACLSRLAEKGDEVTLPTELVLAPTLRISAPGHDVCIHREPGQGEWASLLKKVIREVGSSYCLLPAEEKRLLARLPLGTEGAVYACPGGAVEVHFLVRNPWACPVSVFRVEVGWDQDGMQLCSPDFEGDITLPANGDLVLKRTYTSSREGTFRPNRITYIVRPQNGEKGVQISQPLEKRGKKVVRRNVWGKEDFDDLGPAEYTRDHTWDVRVLAPQAKVDVEVLSWPEDTLYEGEEVTALLRLSNPSDTLPIEHIRFALDQPDHALICPPDSDWDESGGRFPLSLHSPCICSYTTTLQPGDSTEVEVRVRATQTISTLNLLVLFCDDAPHFAKVSLGMSVQPLLGVEVTSSPIRGDPGHWSLLCQTSNLSSHAVEVESLTVCSGSWAIPPPEVKGDGVRPLLSRTWSQPILALQGLPLSSLGASSQPLPPGQLQRTFLTLSPVEHGAGNEEDQLRKYTIHQLSHWFKEKNLDRSLAPPETVAYTISGASPTGVPSQGTVSALYPLMKRAWFKRLLGQVLPSMPTRMREGAFLPHEAYGMDLSIHWRVQNRRGHTDVFNLSGAPGESILPPIMAGLEGRRRAMFAETDSMLKQVIGDLNRSRWGAEQDPVQVTFRVLPTGENGLVRIAISVQNLSPRRACGVRLSLLEGGSEVQWVGRKTFALDVGPRQQMELTGHALVAEEGPLPGYKLHVQPAGLDRQHDSVRSPGLVVRPVY